MMLTQLEDLVTVRSNDVHCEDALSVREILRVCPFCYHRADSTQTLLSCLRLAQPR